MGRLFGTDGVRGVANRELTAELALALGTAAARCLAGPRKPGRRVAVIGRDPRASGEMLEAAVIAGLASQGVDALRVGMLPTPAVAYLTGAYDADFGVMISASHNPMPDNGIKIFGPGGHKLDDDTEDQIEELVAAGPGFAPGRRRHRPRHRRRGCRRSLPAPRGQGQHAAARRPDRGRRLRPRRGSSAAPRAYRAAGARVIAINAEPNGLNINDRCGSTHLESLRAAVLAHGADLGLAHDGDADRCLARRRQRRARRRRRDHGGARAGDARGRRTGGQHAGHHRDEQPRTAPGHAQGGSHGAHDRRRRPLRPRGAAVRRVQPGRRAIRPHRDARAGLHRRRHRHRAALDDAHGADRLVAGRARFEDAVVPAGADQRHGRRQDHRGRRALGAERGRRGRGRTG